MSFRNPDFPEESSASSLFYRAPESRDPRKPITNKPTFVASKLKRCFIIRFCCIYGKLPECPHEGCKSELEIETCKGFLNPELYDIMSSHVKEASIPSTAKVYCPISSCSALMSKTELQKHVSTSSRASGKRKCVKCHRRFCMNCNVAWHNDMTCGEFIESSEYKSANEAKLKSLASSKKWRQYANNRTQIQRWNSLSNRRLSQPLTETHHGRKKNRLRFHCNYQSSIPIRVKEEMLFFDDVIDGS
ncbi:hypothetical protein LXL04_005662 [Taraxacum kok-saghyz]